MIGRTQSQSQSAEVSLKRDLSSCLNAAPVSYRPAEIDGRRTVTCIHLMRTGRIEAAVVSSLILLGTAQ